MDSTDFRPYRKVVGAQGFAVPNAIVTDGDPAKGVGYLSLARTVELLPEDDKERFKQRVQNLRESKDAEEELELRTDAWKQDVYVGRQTFEIDLIPLLAREIKAAFDDLSRSAASGESFNSAVDRIASATADAAHISTILTKIETFGARFAKVEWEMTNFTCIRRALAAGEDVSRFEDEKVAAAAYEAELERQGLIDYEAMVGRALKAILVTPNLPAVLAARFPWIVVDEYQDLGPVLHKIVDTLHRVGSSNIFCVGDPDQSVMGFTGADPRYLLSLEGRPDILSVRLQRNYRSGSAILAAAEVALGEKRNYEAVIERPDGGMIESVAVEGGLDEHARVAADKIIAATDSGVAAHEIAVLYPGRGPLLIELVRAFTSAQIPFINERDERLPMGPLIDFVRTCAARAVAGPQSCGWNAEELSASPLGDIASRLCLAGVVR